MKSLLVLSLLVLSACEPRDGTSKFSGDTGDDCVDDFFELDTPNAGWVNGKTDPVCNLALFYGQTVPTSSPCVPMSGVTAGRLTNDSSNILYPLDGCFGLYMTSDGNTYAAAKGALGTFTIADNTADLFLFNYYEAEDDYWCEDGTVVVESKLLTFDITFIARMRDTRPFERSFETCGDYSGAYPPSPWQAMDVWVINGEYDVSIFPQENIAINQTLASGALVRVR